MAKNTDKQAIENMSDNFRGYATLLRKIKQRVLIAQQRAIYAANEEMLRMYWDIGGMLQQSQDADGWGKKTLQRLAVDLKNDYSEIKGFSVRNMQCMIQFFNEYNQELTMVKGVFSPITQSVIAQLEEYNFTLPQPVRERPFWGVSHRVEPLSRLHLSPSKGIYFFILKFCFMLNNSS